jgi:nitric oxide synthase oxygenase domain/subunit
MSDFQTETIELYFKQVYTCKTKVYPININYTVAQLYEFITAKAFSDDFAINSNSYKIEIVEAGQYDNVNGRDAELAPALEPNSDTTLRQKYGDNIKHKAFYIRPKLFITIPDSPTNDEMIVMAPRT